MPVSVTTTFCSGMLPLAFMLIGLRQWILAVLAEKGDEERAIYAVAERPFINTLKDRVQEQCGELKLDGFHGKTICQTSRRRDRGGLFAPIKCFSRGGLLIFQILPSERMKSSSLGGRKVIAKVRLQNSITVRPMSGIPSISSLLACRPCLRPAISLYELRPSA